MDKGDNGVSFSEFELSDIFNWDISNWSKALKTWSPVLYNGDGKKALEVGSWQGGLSLMLAKCGYDVTCSDLENPESRSVIMKSYPWLQGKVTYEAIDALNIPYQDHFDLIAFKSVLGGVARGGRNDLKRKVFEQILKALKPGGHLIFAENLEGSAMHIVARRTFVKWGRDWNYLAFEEIPEITTGFEVLNLQTFGYLGTFGRTESQRRLLSGIDRSIEPMMQKRSRYIVAGLLKRSA